MRPPRRPASNQEVATWVANAFSDAQRTHAAHRRASKLLLSAFRSSPDVFFSAFTHALNRILLVFPRQPAVERLVSFVASFAAENASSGDDFCSFILAYLLDQTNASSQAVRFRSMQLIAAIIHALPDDADLADEIWEPLQIAALSRALDRVPRVRAAAAGTLCRLQSTADPADDQFTAQIVAMVCKDSSAAVRKAALHAVAISDATLPVVVGRTRDVRADVRRVAFEILANKVDPSCLHLEERISLLQAGLSDRDDAVRKACTETLLLKGWLEGKCQGDVFNLVDLLGCNEYEEKVLRALRIVFASKQHAALVDAIQIDVNNLDHGSVLVLRALGDAQKNEAFMEKFIPSTLAYSEVLLYYAVDDFASRHLLELSKCIDMSDEAGRKAVENVVRKDFLASKLISEATVVGAFLAMRRAMVDEEAATRLILEIVRHDILGSVENGNEDGVDKDQGSADETSDQDRDWTEMRALNICKEVLRSSTPGESSGSANNALCLNLVELAVLPQLMSTDVPKRRCAMECLSLFCLLDRSGTEARTNMPLFLQASRTDVLEIQEVALRAVVDFMMVFDFNEGAVDSSTALDSYEVAEEHQDGPENEAHAENLSSTAEEAVSILSENITHSEGGMRGLAIQGLARLLFVCRISPSPTLLSRMLIAHHNPTTEEDDTLRQCLSVFFPAFAISSPESRLGLEESFRQTCNLLLTAPSKSPLSTISVLQVAQFILHLTNPATATKGQEQRLKEQSGHSAEQTHERLAETVLHDLIDALDSEEIDTSRTYARILAGFRLSYSGQNKDRIDTLLRLARTALKECEDKRVTTMLNRFKDRMSELLELADADEALSQSHAQAAETEAAEALDGVSHAPAQSDSEDETRNESPDSDQETQSFQSANTQRQKISQ